MSSTSRCSTTRSTSLPKRPEPKNEGWRLRAAQDRASPGRFGDCSAGFVERTSECTVIQNGSNQSANGSEFDGC